MDGEWQKVNVLLLYNIHSVIYVYINVVCCFTEMINYYLCRKNKLFMDGSITDRYWRTARATTNAGISNTK